MNFKIQLFLVILLCLVLQSQSNAPKAIITRRVPTSYTLNNSNSWRQFPELKITLTVAQSGLVFIGYVISNSCSSPSHLVTRLRIDLIQNYHFRAISGNTVYHTNSVSNYVFLSAGDHQIRVQYRTPGTFSAVINDWTTASLQVAY